MSATVETLKLEDVLKLEEEDYSRKIPIFNNVLPSGWARLDEALGGGFRNGLYVLTGEPKAGKSALAIYLQLMVALRLGSPIGPHGYAWPLKYCTLELSAADVFMRTLSALSYEAGCLEAFAWPDVPTIIKRSRESGVAYADTPMARAAELLREKAGNGCIDILDLSQGAESDCNYLVEDGEIVDIIYAGDIDEIINEDWPERNYRNGGPAKKTDVEAITGWWKERDDWGNWESTPIASPLTVVDYLQLLTSCRAGAGADVYRTMNSVIAYLRMVGCPVLAISEMNRTALRGTDRGGGRYGASGSSRIEYSALAALRLTLERDEGEAGRKVALHVDLSRYGAPTNSDPLLLRYMPQYNSFCPMD